MGRISYVDRVERHSRTEDWLWDVHLALMMAGLRKSAKFLDYGCGTGRLVNIMTANGFDGFGVDSNQAILMKARDNYPNLDFRYAVSVEAVRDTDFDLVFLSHVIAHVDHPADLLVQLRRVVASGGRLAVISPNFWNWFARIPENVVKGYRSDPTARWSFSPRSFIKMANRCGWSLVRCEMTGTTPMYGMTPPVSLRERFVIILEASDDDSW